MCLSSSDSRPRILSGGSLRPGCLKSVMDPALQDALVGLLSSKRGRDEQ